MKRVLFVLIAVATMGIVSCDDYKQDPSVSDTVYVDSVVANPVFNGYDIDSVIVRDHNFINSLHGVDYVYYECQVNYKHDFDNTSDENQIVKIMNVFQIGDTCYIIYHFTDTLDIAGLIDYSNKVKTCDRYAIDTNELDYTFTLVLRDYWMEDQKINIDSIDVNLDSAYNILMNSGVTPPHSRFVVMRQPDTQQPSTNYPYYIFGGVFDCIAIDSHTGEIVDKF